MMHTLLSWLLGMLLIGLALLTMFTTVIFNRGWNMIEITVVAVVSLWAIGLAFKLMR